MAIVNLYGIHSLKTEKECIIVEAKNIEKLLLELTMLETELTISELKRSLIFVNNKEIKHLNMFKTKISSEDKISILSLIAGG